MTGVRAYIATLMAWQDLTAIGDVVVHSGNCFPPLERSSIEKGSGVSCPCPQWRHFHWSR